MVRMRTMTTNQGAAAAGLSPARFRDEMSRERRRGRDYYAPRDEWPDGRTPLWDAGQVEAWVARRNAKRERLGRA